MAHFLLVLAPQVHIIITDHFPEYTVDFPILNLRFLLYIPAFRCHSFPYSIKINQQTI